MDGKVGENFPRKPELGDAWMIGCGVSDGEGGGEVLVQGGHDDHGEGGVEQVVTPDKDGVKHTLHKDKDRCEKRNVLVRVSSWWFGSRKLDGILQTFTK